MYFISTLILAYLTHSSLIYQSRFLQVAQLSHDQVVYRTIVQQRNLDYIHNHNQKQQSFKLSSNQFVNLEVEQFASIIGSTVPIQFTYQLIQSPPNIGATIPLTTQFQIDWQARGKVSPIKNHGTLCSSCYAFTAIADMQTSYLLSYNKLYDFSEQQIVDCSALFGNSYCVSGFYLYSFQYIIKNGVTIQNNYPYVGISLNCRAISSKLFYIKSYTGFNGNSCNTLTSMLMLRPVIVSVDGANLYWQFYSTGILSFCGYNNVLNHGVQVIGIVKFLNGTNYYIIKNSWGTNWGQNGKLRLDRNVAGGNLCLICSFPYYSNL